MRKIKVIHDCDVGCDVVSDIVLGSETELLPADHQSTKPGAVLTEQSPYTTLTKGQH